MIEKKTIVDKIEIARDGTMQIRLGLLIVEDGVELDCKWHRTAVEPGVSVDNQMELCNAHLISMGRSPADTSEIKKIKDISTLVQTAEVIEAHRISVESAAMNKQIKQAPTDAATRK